MVKASDVLGDNDNFLNATQGVVARKGSIAATLLNAAKYQELLAFPHNAERAEEIKKIILDVTELLPALQAVRLFEFFTLEEWLNGTHSGNEGRAFVAAIYLLHHPKLTTPALVTQLSKCRHAVGKEFQAIIDQILQKVQALSEGSFYDE